MSSIEPRKQGPGCPFASTVNPEYLQRSLVEPEILTWPNDFYRAARLSDPIHYDEKLGMYLVSRYEDLQTVLRDPITFSLEQGWKSQFGGPHFEEFKQILIREGGGYFPDAILQDPPAHGRIRRLLQNAFTAHRVKTLEPMITKLYAQRIEQFADKGKADGVKDFAMPMAISIMCEQLGLNHADSDNIMKWAYAYTAQVGGIQSREQAIANAKIVCELQNYIIARVRERQAERKEDMISDLIHARSDDGKDAALTFGEIVSLARALVVGGNETIATALANLILFVATNPAVAAQLEDSIDDDAKLSRFVEEVIRIEPPARGTWRMTTKEVELGGKRLAAGARLMLLYASGNDDESVFDHPRTFDMNRKNLTKHLSFGAGIHLCIGMSLARMEVKVGVREITKRLKDIKLAIPVDQIRYVPTVSVLAMESLPLTFSRRR